MRAGVEAAEIAQRYHRLFVEKGYEKNFLYGPCHGWGMIEVEPPWMEVTSHYLLEENMTFQVDTFVQDVDFGLRWENGVRVTATGVEMLSNRNMEIIELG
jgi:Xaa-Pro aminopeptidase